MPTSTNVTNLKINELTEAQYDTAVQGGVIGANELSILTDVDAGQLIQVATLPTASADELDTIYQFVGTTDANYTNGYFYKCVSDGQTPAVYSWSRVDVQPGGLVNTATGIEGLTISGTASADNYATNVGALSSASNSGASIGWGAESRTFGVACGAKAKATGSGSVSIGYESIANGNSAVCLGGGGAKATGFQSTALGAGARATASRAIQIGDSTNSDANTFKVANANGNFEIMSADGTIPTARLTKVNTTVTLAVADWSSNTQTVNVTGMTVTGVVMVSPDPTDQSAYTSAGILCTAQAAGTLTFTCDTVPSGDIDVNVVML